MYFYWLILTGILIVKYFQHTIFIFQFVFEVSQSRNLVVYHLVCRKNSKLFFIFFPMHVIQTFILNYALNTHHNDFFLAFFNNILKIKYVLLLFVMNHTLVMLKYNFSLACFIPHPWNPILRQQLVFYLVLNHTILL